MKQQDRTEFIGYLRQCTDSQVQGVYDKERKAKRFDYAQLAEDEANRRDLRLDYGASRRAGQAIEAAYPWGYYSKDEP